MGFHRFRTYKSCFGYPLGKPLDEVILPPLSNFGSGSNWPPFSPPRRFMTNSPIAESTPPHDPATNSPHTHTHTDITYRCNSFRLVIAGS